MVFCVALALAKRRLYFFFFIFFLTKLGSLAQPRTLSNNVVVLRSPQTLCYSADFISHFLLSINFPSSLLRWFVHLVFFVFPHSTFLDFCKCFIRNWTKLFWNKTGDALVRRIVSTNFSFSFSFLKEFVLGTLSKVTKWTVLNYFGAKSKSWRKCLTHSSLIVASSWNNSSLVKLFVYERALKALDFMLDF